MPISDLITKLRYLPEPLFAVHLYGVLFSAPILEQYLFKVFSDELGYNYTYNADTANSDCRPGELNTTSHILLKQVQDKISKFQLKAMMTLNIPPILLILFFGPLSDRYGRKAILLVSFTGYVAWSTIMTLVVWFELNVLFILVAHFIWGCCGYYLAAVVVMIAYVADRTDPSSRAVRIAIVDFILFTAITTSNFSSGKYLQKFGFLACFILMFCIAIISLLWCIFILFESLPPENRADKSESIFLIPKKVFQTVKKQRKDRRKLITYMVVDATVGFTAPVTILNVLVLILLNIPFCWPSSWIGYYRGTLFIIMGLGGVVAVKLLPKLMVEPFVIVVACLSSAGFLVAFSLARKVWSAYVSILAGLFAFSAQPTTRGMISQIVDADEQGSIFSLLGFFQTIVSLIASLAYNAIYIYTNQHDKPATVFILASFTMIVPISICIIYYVVERRKRNIFGENADEQSNKYSTLDDTHEAPLN